MSRSLKKPPPARGFFGKLFGQAGGEPGTFAYLFVATRHKEPANQQEAQELLYAFVSLCVPDWSSSPPDGKGRIAAYYETDVVDRGQLIAWASKAFAEKFKAMSTKYDLSFSRFEHPSGNGQVLVARHR
jgi:hypothetical protein